MKKPLSPKLSDNLSTNSPTFLEDESFLNAQKVNEKEYTFQEIEHPTFENCYFHKVLFNGSQFRHFEAQDIVFDHCDFSNVDMIGASLHRVAFKNCKLTGANFAESVLRDCSFHDCLGDFVSFSYSDMKFVAFEECLLKESDFFEVKWQHLTLTKCLLTGGNWFNTPLAKLNLSSCTFEQLTFSQDKLKGVIVNQEQAITLALGLGIVIDENM